METKASWSDRSWIVRWWIITFCKHPWRYTYKIDTVYPNDEPPIPDYKLAIHVRRCRICRQYYLDAGYEMDK